MYCQFCGKETPDQAIFCHHCGARLNKECPRCAEIVRVKAKICRFCGYEFTPEEIAEIEKLEQERKVQYQREKREREEREKAGLEERREEEEYERWHRPEIVGAWGSVVLKCPQCSTLNALRLENCRRCSASLKSAAQVKNPYC